MSAEHLLFSVRILRNHRMYVARHYGSTFRGVEILKWALPVFCDKDCQSNCDENPSPPGGSTKGKTLSRGNMRHSNLSDIQRTNLSSYRVLRGLECPVHMSPNVTKRPTTYAFPWLQILRVQLTRCHSRRPDASQLCFCLPGPDIFQDHDYGRRNTDFSLR